MHHCSFGKCWIKWCSNVLEERTLSLSDSDITRWMHKQETDRRLWHANTTTIISQRVSVSLLSHLGVAEERTFLKCRSDHSTLLLTTHGSVQKGSPQV